MSDLMLTMQKCNFFQRIYRLRKFKLKGSPCENQLQFGYLNMIYANVLILKMSVMNLLLAIIFVLMHYQDLWVNASDFNNISTTGLHEDCLITWRESCENPAWTRCTYTKIPTTNAVGIFYYFVNLF